VRHAVILAGGWGERLWPMSTRARPKQLLALAGEESLIRATLARVAPLVDGESTLVMTGERLAGRVAEELPDVPRERVIGEPVGRNTAPAIALAARLLVRRDPEAVMVVLPADHVIADGAAFRDVLSLAFEAALAEGALVTLGIRPGRPETEYGYIKAGSPARTAGVLAVERFVEKPDRETAARYLADGTYLWNSGIFIWRADRFLEEVGRLLPAVARALVGVEAGLSSASFEGEMARYYEAVPSISVDYGIMEKSDDVVVVPCDVGWDDVGAWSALERVWTVDADGNAVRGESVVVDSTGCVVYSEAGVTAVVGLRDIVVARTSEGTLVVPKERARDVRKIVEELKRRGTIG